MTRQPIWQRLFAPGELIVQALAVSRADQSGVIDGVEVDFRHPDLGPGEWEPAIMWHSFGAYSGRRLRQLVSPFVFPFEHNKDDAELAETVIAPPELVRPVRVFAGDRISVDRVETMSFENRDFEDRDEKAVKFAYLKVTRKGGGEVAAPWPLQFNGRGNVVDAAFADSAAEPDGLREALVYERLAYRIERNAADLLQGDTPWIGPAEHRHSAAIRAADAHRDLEELLTVLDAAMLNADERLRWRLNAAKVDAVRVASNAMQAGYSLARHDLAPAEPSALASMRNRAKAVSITTDNGAREYGRKRFAEGASRSAIAREIAKSRGQEGDQSVHRSLMKTLEVVDPKHKRFRGGDNL